MPESRRPADDPGDLRIDRAIIAEFFVQMRHVYLVEIVCALVVAAIYVGRLPGVFLAAWLTGHGLLVLHRFAAFRRFTLEFKADPLMSAERVAYWKRSEAAAALALGGLWGAWAALGQNAFPGSLPFTMALVSGTLTGATIVLSLSMPSFVLCYFAYLLPFAATVALNPDPIQRGIGLGGAALLTVLLVPIVRSVQRVVKQTYRIRFENVDLVEDLRHAKDEAERSLTAKTRFLAAASHDLRQPLHALNLFLDTLAAERLDARQRLLTERIKTSARAMQGLLDSLLDLSRVEAGSIIPEIRAFPVAPLLESLRKEFEAPLQRKGLRLAVRSSHRWVRSDPELLGRILRNLLSNALRHCPSGRVVLGASVRGGTMAFTVEDEGPGIPLEEQENVFLEFQQLSNPERDRSKGVGLGLSIVRNLGKLLGHPVTLVSLPELKGCRFTIEVPTARPQKVAVRTARPRGNSGRLARRSILVVDDNAESRASLAAALESLGQKCRTAADGRSALKIVRATPPDVLLCDYRLRAGENGLDVLEALQAQFPRRIPCALVTGDTDPQRLREARGSGVPLLHKPLGRTEIASFLRKIPIRSRPAPTETPQ
jgi:signal transduction histidine kinase